MCMSEYGIKERKWEPYPVLRKLLEEQKPLLDAWELMATLRPSTARSDEEYWSECLDIYRRLRGYAATLTELNFSSSPRSEEENYRLSKDLDYLELNVREISEYFSKVADDIGIIRRKIGDETKRFR